MGKVEEEKGPAQTGTATTKKQRLLLGARLETATLDSSARYSVAIEYMCPGAAAEAAAQSVLVLA